MGFCCYCWFVLGFGELSCVGIVLGFLVEEDREFSVEWEVVMLKDLWGV